MRVVVTGGTGFVGKRLIERLAARGDEVAVLTRDPDAASRRGLAAARLAAWDPLGGKPPASFLASAGAVVNLLGESIAKGRWTSAKKQRIRDSRVIGTRNLVAGIAAASPPPRVFVSGSAIGFYGPRGEERLDESSPPGSDFLSGVARDWEAEALRAAGCGARVALLRTGIVLGRDGGALKAMLTPFRLGLGGPVGSGAQWMSWIHIEDLCGLILHVIDRPALAGPVNGTSPEPATNRDFSRALGAVLGRPAFLPIPGIALKILLGEMATALLLSGQRVIPKRAEETGFRFKYPDLQGALAEVLQGLRR
jgi:hypothetical protein